MGDLLVNQRPSRAIKRRRYSDETAAEQMDLEFVFKSRNEQTTSPSTSHKTDELTRDSNPDTNSEATNDTNVLSSLSTATVNIPAGKKLKHSTKRLKNKAQFMNSVWRAEDDLLLMDAVIQTNNLLSVFAAVKFSTHFTLQEIQERWEALLYDSSMSKFAQGRISKLTIDVRKLLLAKAIFSEAEEQILCDITSTEIPSLEVFQTTLNEHRNVFHVSRTAKSLRNHWLLLRRYHLLSNQVINQSVNPEEFSDVEERVSEMTNDSLDKPQFKDPVIQNEINLAGMRAQEEIKVLETELPRWQFLMANATGNKFTDFDKSTYAVIRGHSARFVMESRTISIGRSCRGNKVDVDLSLEGPSHKISRVQAIIRLLDSCMFLFINQGKRPVFVDGKPVLPGNKRRLLDNSVIIICKLALLFQTNNDLIAQMREEYNSNVLRKIAHNNSNATKLKEKEKQQKL